MLHLAIEQASTSYLSSLVTSLGANEVSYVKVAIYQEFRAGDVRHSQADISKAKGLLGYQPEFRIQQGIDKAMPWYIKFLTTSNN